MILLPAQSVAAVLLTDYHAPSYAVASLSNYPSIISH
jgi:hypothetical protein